MKKIESGFSLIELLVVVAIIGILAAVGTVGYGNYLKSSKQKSVAANVANIAAAIGTFDAAVGAGVETGVNLSTYQTNNLSNFKNPYGGLTVFSNVAPACATAGNEGVISIVKSGTTITVSGCYDIATTAGLPSATATVSASTW